MGCAPFGPRRGGRCALLPGTTAHNSPESHKHNHAHTRWPYSWALTMSSHTRLRPRHIGPTAPRTCSRSTRWGSFFGPLCLDRSVWCQWCVVTGLRLDIGVCRDMHYAHCSNPHPSSRTSYPAHAAPKTDRITDTECELEWWTGHLVPVYSKLTQ